MFDRDPDGSLVLIADPAPETWQHQLSARFEKKLRGCHKLGGLRAAYCQKKNT